jgi:8-amino-7-oxononanoate synthase
MSQHTDDPRLGDRRATLQRLMEGRTYPATSAGSTSSHQDPCAPLVRRLEEAPEVIEFYARMEKLRALGLSDPCFRVVESPTQGTVVIEGRELVDYSGYNYLGLASDHRVKDAAQSAIEELGTSASASRLASGERAVHGALERALSDFLGVEDAMVFTAGYSTNQSVLGHLLAPADLVLHDELAHSSIILGCQLSRARRLAFPHNDVVGLEQLLVRNRYHCPKALVVVEGAYSMDGDFADLPGLVAVAERHQASLFVDEAHSLGVMGKTGRGLGEHFGIERSRVELWMGTLSKSLGSVGGYVAGSRRLIEYLKYTTPGFIFSAGMPPSAAAAALTALQVLDQEPWRVTQLQHNARRFLDLAKGAGLDTGLAHQTAVIPIMVRDTARCLQLSTRLFHQGINVFPMTYPAVAEDQARLRFFVTSEHTESQLTRTILALAQLMFGSNDPPAKASR